jgi:hypothetical protein
MVQVSKRDEEAERGLMDMYETNSFIGKDGKPLPPDLPEDTSEDPENDRGEE